MQLVSNSISNLIIEADSQFSNRSSLEKNEQKIYDQLLSAANFANNALHKLLSEIQQSSSKNILY